MEQTRSQRPLEGVRIFDLTTVVMGPMATRIFADLGAEVIRVETPEGDFMRHFDPKRSDGMSGFALNINRNKHSVVLDLKTDVGVTAAMDLIKTCDVFITNMRTAAVERLGFGYDAVRAEHPEIIYVAANGFGSDGPYHAKAAYDDVIQAASGFASMFSWLGDEPAFVPTIIADKVASLHIAYATIAALYRKASTGYGDHVEVPMAECLASFNLVEHLMGHTFVPEVGTFSYQRMMTKHRRPRRAKDGWLCVLPYTDRNWRDFFIAVGHPEHLDDPRFSTVNARVTNVDALYELLDSFMPTRTVAEWQQLCDDLSIPNAPVTDLENIASDPHFEAVGLLAEAEHPTEGRYKVVKDPVTFASSPSTIRRHAPKVGADTRSVFTAIGYNQDQIEAVLALGTQRQP